MIKADVETVLNKREVDKLTDEIIDALVITAGLLQDRIREAQVIPRDTGLLQGEKFYIDDSRRNEGHVALVNRGPYARRLYYHPEYNFRQDKNEFAQGLWFTLWQDGGVYENEPREIFEKVLAEITGGE